MDAISYRLEAFEGPLDLLLSLIQKNKMSIDNIQINVICEQYIQYIEENPEQKIKQYFLGNARLGPLSECSGNGVGGTPPAGGKQGRTADSAVPGSGSGRSAGGSVCRVGEPAKKRPELF